MSVKSSSLHVEERAIQWQKVGEGVQRKILGYDPQLMMTHVRFKKGSIGPVHKHVHRQVTFVEHGSFEVYIGMEKKILTKGDCFFIPPDVDHGVIALEDGGLVDVFTPTREDFLINR